MRLPDVVRNSGLLREPLLSFARWILGWMYHGPGVFRRAIYDAMPGPYVLAGGREKYIVSTADKVIGRDVFLNGEFDFSKLVSAVDILRREGRPVPRHLIDVGANIGTITIPAIKRGLMETSVAVEPHPENLKLLRANLFLNEVDERVVVLPAAAGAVTGASLYLNESADNSGNHSISASGVPTRSVRLDDLNIPGDSLLWMDIEGYEGHALAGASRLMNTGINLVCELNPEYLEKSGGLHLFIDMLAGRLIFDLSDPLGNVVSLEELVQELREKRNFTDILAIPPRNNE